MYFALSVVKTISGIARCKLAARPFRRNARAAGGQISVAGSGTSAPAFPAPANTRKVRDTSGLHRWFCREWIKDKCAFLQRFVWLRSVVRGACRIVFARLSSWQPFARYQRSVRQHETDESADFQNEDSQQSHVQITERGIVVVIQRSHVGQVKLFIAFLIIGNRFHRLRTKQ